MEADVSAVADPATGVAVYDTYGGKRLGGLRRHQRLLADHRRRLRPRGHPGSSDYPAKYPYGHTGNLNDVTSGSNGSCTTSYFCKATTGYDGPTGWGTPNGTAAFTSGAAPAATRSP